MDINIGYHKWNNKEQKDLVKSCKNILNTVKIRKYIKYLKLPKNIGKLYRVTNFLE